MAHIFAHNFPIEIVEEYTRQDFECLRCTEDVTLEWYLKHSFSVPYEQYQSLIMFMVLCMFIKKFDVHICGAIIFLVCR